MDDKILVVEDDKEINELICKVLKESKYDVKCVFNGLDALKVVNKEKFDLIILDIMLPYKSGDEVLKEIRKNFFMPVIVLSAKGLTQTKVELFKLGADDYVTKPFDLDEILARVQSNLRRWNFKKQFSEDENINEVLKYKDIELNTESKEVLVNGKEIVLTLKEYKILELFLKNKEKVFSKANIFESIWQEEYYSDDDTLNTHISNIRNKLKKANKEEKYIETVWGLGYRLCKI